MNSPLGRGTLESTLHQCTGTRERMQDLILRKYAKYARGCVGMWGLTSRGSVSWRVPMWKQYSFCAGKGQIPVVRSGFPSIALLTCGLSLASGHSFKTVQNASSYPGCQFLLICAYSFSLFPSWPCFPWIGNANSHAHASLSHLYTGTVLEA